MKIIGITGGVGAGKSTVLDILKKLSICEIAMADDVAKELMQYGRELSTLAISIFGEESYNKDKILNTAHIAQLMYENENLKKQWTNAVHPAVKKEILNRIDNAKQKGNLEFFFIEAALLLEDGYDLICDEIWYIYAPEDIRIKRIMDSRGYSLSKSQSIISSQKKHEEFISKCDFTIDNGISIENTQVQLQNKLEEIRLM